MFTLIAMTSHYIEWSVSGYWFYIGMSIFNLVLFTVLIINMAILPPKYRKYLYQNKCAWVIWIDIIFASITAIFVNFPIIFAFKSQCYEQDISCTRCTIGGNAEHLLIMVSIVARLFVILKSVEINIQPFEFIAYNQKFITGIKIFLWFLLLFLNMVYIVVLPTPMRVLKLRADSSKQICTESKDDETVENRKFSLGIAGPIVITLHIALCVLFIRKLAVLYRRIKHQSMSSDRLEKLRNLIKPITRHTILVVTISVAGMMLILVKQIVDPKGVPLFPVENLVVGLCVIMMFPFGKGIFIHFVT